MYSRTSGFLEKTTHRLLTLLEETFFAYESSQKNGVLQNIHSEAKLISVFCLLITLTKIQSLGIFVAVLFVEYYLAYMSKIRITHLIKRSGIPAIVFSGIVVLPVLFRQSANAMTTGTLWAASGFELMPTNGEIMFVIVFITKILCIVTLTSMLLLTTPWHAVVHALRIIRVPRIFISIVLITERYIYITIETALNIFEAKITRTVRILTRAEEQSMLGGVTSSLFGNITNKSEMVYQAMNARGYSGYKQYHTTERWKIVDYTVVVFSIVSCCTALFLSI